ncbi:hypothetical protein [Lysobacter xanthus]
MLFASIRCRFDDVLERPNDGMNIGAWDAAWRRWPGRSAYLFVQDECRAIADDWFARYLHILDQPGVGLVGECFNAAWDAAWDSLRNGPGRDRLPEHRLDGRDANRVDVYLDAMRRFGIEPGPRGRHLRALTWAVSGTTMQAIGGFPSGRNYGECIAAEIAVSRAVESQGLALRQVGDAPFDVFRHREWNQEHAGGAFTHRAVYLRERDALREQLARLQREAAPDWRRWLRAVFARAGGDVG